jgi:murein DD-endopeptidase MepM/ murein hydrolase activator NlpD
MRIALDPQRNRRGWAVLLALALLGAALTFALLAPGAPAESLDEQLDDTEAKLDEVRQHKGVLTTTISHYTDRIDRLEGQVAALRNREAVVQQRLNEKQAQLDRAQVQLDREYDHLKVLRGHLKRALISLRERLVTIYQTGNPDTLTVLFESNGWSDFVTRNEYVDQLRDQDQLLAGRVRSLRNQTRALVERLRAARDRIEAARNAIAAHKQELVSTRTSIEQRQGQLVRARGERAAVLDRIEEHEQHLEGKLGDIQAEIAEQLLGPGVALPAGPVRGGSSGLIWPVNGAVVSGFGMRWGSMHEGVDIAVPAGTPILAAASGTVALAGPTGGYGNYTCVDHGGGLSTCYAHQSAIAASSGQSVSQAQVIGYVGCTGHCFGDHLHFEVRINGAAVDPMGYL